MTLHAARKPGTEFVTVSMTSGSITAQVEETAGHLLFFWHELGRIVAVEDNERRAQAGYARYMAHSHLVNKTTFTHRAWGELDDDTRSHWVEAFTE